MARLTVCPYEHLYLEHHGWLRRRLGCRHTAADLAHDTFVRLLGRPMATELAEPRAYLARIAHGLVIDQSRRRMLEEAYLEALAAAPEQYVPSPEEQAQIVEALARIDALLNGLKPRARTVFLLSRLEGLTHPQIGSPPRRRVVLALRGFGTILLGASLALALLRDGPSFGSLLWATAISLAALAAAFTLAWCPKVLRPLSVFRRCRPVG